MVKMHARRAAYGPLTQRRIDQLASSTLSLYCQMFAEGKQQGEWAGGLSAELAAAYVAAQVALGVSQRAQARTPKEVRAMMEVAFAGLTSHTEGGASAPAN